MGILNNNRDDMDPVLVEISSQLGLEYRIDLKLKSDSHTGAIRGIVTDPSGKPLSGAMVQLATNGFKPVENCLTEQDGSFAFLSVPAEDLYWLYACGKGYRVSDTPAFYLEVNQEIFRHIRLHPQKDEPLCIAGKVTDSTGLPPAISAVLVLQLVDGVLNYHSFCFCDSSGSFAVTDLEPGSYLMRIVSEGHAPMVRNLRIGPQDGLIQLDFVVSDT